MTSTTDDRIAELTAHESRFLLDGFDHTSAWRLGQLMVERALDADASVIIEIRRPELVLFRAALTGTNAENEAWLDRKARTVFRYEASTALVGARFEAQGVDVWTAGWFDSDRFTVAGGSFPVRVRGVGVVAAVTVSGLTSDEDHDFIIASLDAYVRDQD